MNDSRIIDDLTLILEGYASGYFLMSDNDQLGWYSSRIHALIPLDDRLHVPRSLQRKLNNPRFESRLNNDFPGTVHGCAARKERWISSELEAIYLRLFEAGHALSYEIWIDGALAGGVLGIQIGGAFIGESMFTRVPEASKVALVRLARWLAASGFVLFDAQVQNPHLKRFGAFEVAEREFRRLLSEAISHKPRFAPLDNIPPKQLSFSV